jgi:hypothetical protein
MCRGELAPAVGHLNDVTRLLQLEERKRRPQLLPLARECLCCGLRRLRRHRRLQYPPLTRARLRRLLLLPILAPAASREAQGAHRAGQRVVPHLQGVEEARGDNSGKA